MGKSYSDLSRYPDAERSYFRAYNLVKEKDLDKQDENRDLVSLCLYYIGNYYSEIHRYDEARHYIMDALHVRRALVQIHGEQYYSDLASSLRSLARYYSRINAPYAAQIKFEEAVSVLRRVADTDPEKGYPALSDSLNALGLLYQQNKIQDPEVLFLESMKVMRELSLLHPDRYSLAYAETLLYGGMYYLGAGKFENVEPIVLEALGIHRGYQEKNPETSPGEIFKSVFFLAFVYLFTDRYQEYEKVIKECDEHADTLIRRNPDFFLEEIAQAYPALGNRLSELEKYDEARYRYERFLEIYLALPESRLINWLKMSKEVIDKLFYIYVKDLDNPDTAILSRILMENIERLSKKDLVSYTKSRFLLTSLVSRVLCDSNNFEIPINLFSGLIDKYPKNYEILSNEEKFILIKIHNNLGSVYHEKKDYNRLIQSLEESLSILRCISKRSEEFSDVQTYLNDAYAWAIKTRDENKSFVHKIFHSMKILLSKPPADETGESTGFNESMIKNSILFEPEKEYHFYVDDDENCFFYVPQKQDEPDEDSFLLYNGGDIALYYRNHSRYMLMNYLHPSLYEVLMEIHKVSFREIENRYFNPDSDTLGDADILKKIPVLREYNVPVIHGKLVDLPCEYKQNQTFLNIIGKQDRPDRWLFDIVQAINFIY
jgi:tetratricopeptide (TPR) repeat protein